MPDIVVKLPKVFKPLNDSIRYKVMYGGRGSAKSWTVARKLALLGAASPLLILCTRELQKSIKQSVHRLIKDQIKLVGLEGFYTITDHSIRGQNGTEFIFLGTKHNPDEIRSTEGVDICWIEEGHNLTEGSWDVIDPTIRKPGSEIWITFNTRFKFDHLYQVFIANPPPPKSWVKKVNHQDNPYFHETEMPLQMEHMKDTDFEKYLHIWEGELKTLAQGAIFGKQILAAKAEGRLCKVPVASTSVVYTFWDLGRNDHNVIWWMQNIGKEFRFIDYYECRLEDIEHYCRVIAGQSTDHEMKKYNISEADNKRRNGYNYDGHWMPHDVETMVLGMKKSRRQQFEDGNVKPVHTVARISNKLDAISMARDVFPECWFDTERCERGIEALSNYRYEYNDDKDTHNQTPYHDWASNGADGFMQFAQGFVITEEYKPLPKGRTRHRA